jgi:hypothetical protein
MKQLLLLIAIVIFASCQEPNSKPAIINNPTDSLNTDYYTLLFYPQDSFPAVKFYDDEDERNKLIDSNWNWHQKAMTIQKYLAEKHKDLFFLTDSTLVLKLENGKTKSYTLVDTIKDESFAFEQYFKNINYYLLRVQYNEGNAWMLVNRQNGFQKYIGGVPYISPNNQHILVLGADLEAGYNFNGIELYSVAKDSLNLEFSKETKFGPNEANWISNDHFLLKRDLVDTDSVNQTKSFRVNYCSVQLIKKTN